MHDDPPETCWNCGNDVPRERASHFCSPDCVETYWGSPASADA